MFLTPQIDESRFQALADEGYTRIPLVSEVLADLDTPLSVYLKFATAPHTYLLESVQGGEKWGRYSMIGLPCRQRIEVHDKQINVFDGDSVVDSLQMDDPLEFIEQYSARFKVPELPGLPRFAGGLVGYFGYDTVRYIEPRLGECPNPDELNTPDILLMLSEEVIVFDNLSGKLFLIVQVDPALPNAYAQGSKRLKVLQRQLREPLELPSLLASPVDLSESDFVVGFSQQGFEQAVESARQYITDGDVMQVVLSQRSSASFEFDPLDLYRALRSLNPSPYMFFLDHGSFQVVGSSPEILVRMEDQMVSVRPIAGTRPRGENEAEDKALERDLLDDPKELAEHLMLIDLGRNDVGRVAQTGTVEVTEQMIVERYSHVMHIVSNVVGQVDADMSAMDVLRATFPAGTVSGAPKVRAMEIIDELEPVKRGIYAGAVGYLSWNGNIDTAIAIRTAVIKDGKLHIQAGAGIVYDSVPLSEWEETLNKGRAVKRAASWVAQGLDRSGHQ